MEPSPLEAASDWEGLGIEAFRRWSEANGDGCWFVPGLKKVGLGRGPQWAVRLRGRILVTLAVADLNPGDFWGESCSYSKG